MARPVLSLEIAELFYSLTNSVYMRWKIYRHLFDDNPDAGKFQKGWPSRCLREINMQMQEYVLFEIAKLHDRPVGISGINLTIDYVIDFGGWTEPVRAKLVELKVEMEEVAGKVRIARNKLLAHNDLKTIIEGKGLGAFTENADIKYFEDLQAFVDVVFYELTGEPKPFYDLIINEAEDLRQILLRGWVAPPRG